MDTNTQTIPGKETLKDSAEDLLRHAADYAETWYERALVTLTTRTVKTGASIMNALLVLVLGLVVFFFLNFALGWWLGQVLASRALGFLVLGAFYLLLLIIVVAARKTFMQGLRNKLTRMFYE